MRCQNLSFDRAFYLLMPFHTLQLFLYHYADFIAVSWLGDKRCTPLLAVLSFSFIPCCIHACINGYYYGLKKTAVPSLCQLTEQFARVGSVYLMYQIAVSEGKSLTLSMVVWGIVCGEAASTLVSVSVFGSPMETGAPRQKQEKSLYLHQKSALHGSSLNLKQDRSKFICRV